MAKNNLYNKDPYETHVGNIAGGGGKLWQTAMANKKFMKQVASELMPKSSPKLGDNLIKATKKS